MSHILKPLPPLRASYRLTPRGEWLRTAVQATAAAVLAALTFLAMCVVAVLILAEWFSGVVS